MTKDRSSKISALLPWTIGLLLTGAVFAVYGQVGGHDFLHFDDPHYVAENAHVKEGMTVEGIRWALTATHAANWHPVTWLSHMLDVELFGMDPGKHHLVNVLFHAVNSLLLLAVFRKMTGRLWSSAAVAALFALHPMHVESVAWISERKDMLSTFFWMLTLWAYLAYVERPGTGRYAAVLTGLVLGLMSKPMVVTLPFVLLLMDLWPLGRFPLISGSHEKAFRPWMIFLEKAPFIVLSLVSCVITYHVQKIGGAVNSLAALPATDRFANAALSYVRYMEKLVWPTDLAVFYPYPSQIAGWQTAGSLLLLTAVSGGVVLRIRKNPCLFVGWFWFLGTLVPVIGLVQAGLQAMADRYAYIPSVGFFVFVVFGARSVWPRAVGKSLVAPLVAGGVIVLFSWIGWMQAAYWKSSVALFSHALRVTEDNFVVHNLLGMTLAADGKREEAMAHYRRALAIHPQFDPARGNLAVAYLDKGELENAEAQLRKLPDTYPKVERLHFNLANALMSIRQVDTAVHHFQKAVAIDPGFADAHNNLGLAMVRKNRLDEAVICFGKAAEIQPDHPEARANLLQAQTDMKKTESAGMGNALNSD